MHSLDSISAIASEKKRFLYFPIRSCFNTISCGGNHLGFRIGIQKKLLRGPSNDYSWVDWLQLANWFKRSGLKHFATAGNRLDPMGKCSNAFFSETTKMIEAKLNMNIHWMVLYKL
jgi:hypothetical protein